MKNIKLKTKLFTGFFSVLFLLVIVALLGFFSLNASTSGFKKYREMARDSNLIGILQADMLMVRMNVKDFIITGSEKDLEEYRGYIKEMQKQYKIAEKEINKKERREKIDFIEKEVIEYQQSFARVIEFKKKRNHIVNDILNVKGKEMEKHLTKIMITAEEDRDIKAAFYAGMALRDLLLGRLYVVKFLDSNSRADAQRALSEFSALKKNMVMLKAEIQNQNRIRLLEKVEEEDDAYVKGFNELISIIFKRNRIINDSLDRIGPEIAKTVNEVKLDIKAEQDSIGPRLQVSNQRSEAIMTGISLVCIIFGICVVSYITKSVFSQLGSDPGELAEIAENISKGNLAIQFDDDETKNRGVYSAMRNMTQNLSGIIKDISAGVDTLDSSSGDLSVISEQMSANVEDTARRSVNMGNSSEKMTASMNNVIASGSQTNASIQSIVSAVEEMSSTINEIAVKTSKGSEITDKAVTTAKDVSMKVDELGNAASEISKVTETISDISEQTNLLALNATIEAARAGEAGKGFAVVAGEIKTLAQQTAEATIEISSKITEVQTTTRESVVAIDSIVNIINEINEVVTSVAAAIEEQSLTTQEISENLHQSATGVNEVGSNMTLLSEVIDGVNHDISHMKNTTKEVKKGGIQIKESSIKLSELSDSLRQMVSRFEV